MNTKLKQKIASWFSITIADLNEEFPDQAAKKFGEQKGVSFELDGLVKTFCSVTHWASGEGFDISWETENNTTIHSWEDKRISLHETELECFLACLNDLKHFDA
jgi:hypothetical protein